MLPELPNNGATAVGNGVAQSSAVTIESVEFELVELEAVDVECSPPSDGSPWSTVSGEEAVSAARCTGMLTCRSPSCVPPDAAVPFGEGAVPAVVSVGSASGVAAAGSGSACPRIGACAMDDRGAETLVGVLPDIGEWNPVPGPAESV